MAMHILDTERLRLRTIDEEDAPFYLELLNSEPFIANIGDRGIRTLPAARAAIAAGPVAMQQTHGHSIYLVELLHSGEPIGMAGLIKRDALDDVDLGYGLLPPHFGRGYATEAARALLVHAREAVGLRRLLAITSPHNHASHALLLKIGMRYQGVLQLDDGPARLYAIGLASGA
ncbi:GNAT family N-acetyltransferase [Massilia sp. TSP1-1-2]|uniref:GNAT family N-acetyltransferase n=1 Tax=Massilia sp. TSP1-1-2 TaxID=2804649 RepID=UPI003CED1930